MADMFWNVIILAPFLLPVWVIVLDWKAEDKRADQAQAIRDKQGYDRRLSQQRVTSAMDNDMNSGGM